MISLLVHDFQMFFIVLDHANACASWSKYTTTICHVRYENYVQQDSAKLREKNYLLCRKPRVQNEKKWTKNLQFKIIPRWRKMRRFISNLLLILLTCVYVSARTRFLTYRNVATNPYGTDYASNQYGGRFGHKNTVRIRKPDASLPDV